MILSGSMGFHPPHTHTHKSVFSRDPKDPDFWSSVPASPSSCLLCPVGSGCPGHPRPGLCDIAGFRLGSLLCVQSGFCLQWKAWERVGLTAFSSLFSRAASFPEPVGHFDQLSSHFWQEGLGGPPAALRTGSRRFYSWLEQAAQSCNCF